MESMKMYKICWNNKASVWLTPVAILRVNILMWTAFQSIFIPVNKGLLKYYIFFQMLSSNQDIFTIWTIFAVEGKFKKRLNDVS